MISGFPPLKASTPFLSVGQSIPEIMQIGILIIGSKRSSATLKVQRLGVVYVNQTFEPIIAPLNVHDTHHHR